MKRESHTIEEVVDYLTDLKRRGIIGSMEITLHDSNITNIRHVENYRPGALPKPSAALRSLTA